MLRELAIYIFDNKKIKSAKSPNNKENPGFLNVVTINTDTTVSAYFWQEQIIHHFQYDTGKLAKITPTVLIC